MAVTVDFVADSPLHSDVEGNSNTFLRISIASSEQIAWHFVKGLSISTGIAKSSANRIPNVEKKNSISGQQEKFRKLGIGI
jgi:hypothetical protein